MGAGSKKLDASGQVPHCPVQGLVLIRSLNFMGRSREHTEDQIRQRW